MNLLHVYLKDTLVGRLERNRGGGWQFRFEDSYLQMPSRPVLGQTFEDEPGRPRRSSSRLPAFFVNLLPEGALRELVGKPEGRKLSAPPTSTWEEPELLARLGGDLPGAVVVTAENGDEVETMTTGKEDPADVEAHGGEWKFSLAGAQLKFSPVRRGKRLTIPVGGQGGDWILKIPSPSYPSLPTNEVSMLTWARAAGLDVPEAELVDLAQVEGLPAIPEDLPATGFLIRRFDRCSEGRLHQEDFAQVLSIYPEHRFVAANFEALARIVLAVCGEEDLRELVQRLVFNVLCGNGDAHLKNWALLYPDGRRARLSPAYDLVFTRAYLPSDDLALNLDGTKRFEEITHASFRRLGEKIPFEPPTVEQWAREAAERMRAAWSELRAELPMPAEMKKALERHLESIRL